MPSPDHPTPANSSRGRVSLSRIPAREVVDVPERQKLVVLVDDVRIFRDERPALVARTSSAALSLLASLDGQVIDELWLDHDLVGEDTVQPVVDHLVRQAREGLPTPVRRILVHSANVRAGHRITVELSAARYRTNRWFGADTWRHAWTR